MKDNGISGHHAPSLVAATGEASREPRTVSILGAAPVPATALQSRRGFAPLLVAGSVLVVGGALWASLGEETRSGLGETAFRADRVATPTVLPRTPPMSDGEASVKVPTPDAAPRPAVILEPDVMPARTPTPVAPEPVVPPTVTARQERTAPVAKARAQPRREATARPARTRAAADRRDADVDIITAIVRGARGR